MNIYIIENGQQRGPYTIDQLRYMRITPDTVVWMEGMYNWAKASDVPELKDILAAQDQTQYQTDNQSYGSQAGPQQWSATLRTTLWPTNIWSSAGLSTALWCTTGLSATRLSATLWSSGWLSRHVGHTTEDMDGRVYPRAFVLLSAFRYCRSGLCFEGERTLRRWSLSRSGTGKP